MSTVRVWAVALLAVVASGATATVASPPAAHAAERCDGVWVVVDATELGGPLTTRCAPGNPSSGLEALEAAGHSYTFVPRVPGMVCTIDQRPDPCNGAPSDAYWAYWHAEQGGSWTYGTRGAGNRDPKPGTVEGWAFGAGKRPGTSPPENAPAESSGSGGTGADASDGGSGGSGGSGGGTNEAGGSSGSGGSGGGSNDAGDGTNDSGGAGGSSSNGGSEGASVGGASGPDDASAGAGNAAEETEDSTATRDDGASDDGDDGAADDENTEVRRRGTGADADDILAGRTTGDEDDGGEDGGAADREAPDAREEADEVAIGAPSDGGSWRGAAAGTALAATLGGGAVWQARRRNAATP